MSGPHAHRTAGRSMLFVVAFAALATGVGCASGGANTRVAYTPESFIVAARAQAPDIDPAELVVPFLVTPEMVERALDITSGSMTDFEKADRLMKSITDEDGFGLTYDSVATSTPAVTLEQGYGNCLALTSIFIGLAREIGLSAYYVDASDRVNELRREETVIVDSGHIAGGVRTERGYTLIDYDGHVSRYRTFKIIDDITALAHYYNNLGFELIYDSQAPDDKVPWERILHNFQLATSVRPSFAQAHNNLGVAYTRLGDLEAAESAYRRAIVADSRSDAAYHNLGNLKMRQDELPAALESYDRALDLRRRNPYLHFHRGLAQYRLGDFEAAEKSFKRSISLEREYLEPRNLLAQVYTRQGRLEEAAKVREAVRRLIAEGGR